eukprot:CAMPEP_0172416458 /NCGR_PEP_ID=MMETSP1064-20121228/2944_1 /TAXON_ID=202472 /ORGANISM="Aulacoseira subarctica , Strain CCAP 1002/5" /LENGTH=262 /DNA_ID=CAMNT_0013154125 /DNA_START=168 /DNA_END=956 /DNA_ORIENTATION=+
MVTTELIVDVLNFFDEKPLPNAAEHPVETPLKVNQEPVLEVQEEPANFQVEEVAEEDVPDLVDVQDEDDDELVAEEVAPEPGIAARTRSRTGTDINPPPRYTMVIKINKSKETGDRLKAIEQADKDETELLFIQLNGLLPTREEDVQGKPYNRHMFGVEKFLATGEHDKFKSRLVFNGNEQDQDLFPDRSSPTAALHSIMACLTVAASKGMTRIGKIDVKGAFIQTEMEGPPVYVRCDKNLTRLIVEVLPAIKKYVTPAGTL